MQAVVVKPPPVVFEVAGLRWFAAVPPMPLVAVLPVELAPVERLAVLRLLYPVRCHSRQAPSTLRCNLHFLFAGERRHEKVCREAAASPERGTRR